MIGFDTKEPVWKCFYLFLAPIEEVAHPVYEPRRLFHADFLPYFRKRWFCQLSSVWEEERWHAGKAIVQVDQLLSRLIIAVNVYLVYIDLVSLEKVFYTS